MHCARAALLSYGIFVVTAIVGFGGNAWGDEPAKSPRVLRAGAYACDISPQNYPISSNGQMTDRHVLRCHDPLHARCLVLDNGLVKQAFVVCDSCMIPRDLMDAAKVRIERSTGIPAAHILISATHTHTAPTVIGLFQSEPDAEYRKFLVDRIVVGVETAAQRAQPAKIGWGVALNANQVFNRRWYLQPEVVNEDPFGGKTDRVRMNPGAGNPQLVKASGPVDPEVGFVAVRTTAGKPLALLANYSLHYVGGVPGDSLSADYFGEFATQIGLKLGNGKLDPEFVGLLSNGTSGNINNVNFTKKADPYPPMERIRLVATDVAERVHEALQKVTFHDWVPLGVAQREVKLKVRVPNTKELQQAEAKLKQAGAGPYTDRKLIYARETVLMGAFPKQVESLLQVYRIGDLAICSTPCETFVETGLALKLHSPFKQTFTVSLANGYNGYLPTPEHHDLGGYETWRARSSYLDRSAEPVVRSTLLRMLNDVWKSPPAK